MAERHLILDELVARGLVQPEVAADVIKRAEETNRYILKVLLAENLVQEIDIYKVASDFTQVEFVDPAEVNIDPKATVRFTGDQARRFRAIPYGFRGNSILFAVDDPSNPNLQDDLRRFMKAEPILLLTTPTILDHQINEIYRAGDELEGIGTALAAETIVREDPSNLAELESDSDAPVIKWVNVLITQAVNDRASDIHIEPSEHSVNVRYRIDGVLHNQISSPKKNLLPIVSRVKIMCGMDISEKRIPQDGRTTQTIGDKKVDLRIVTIPTVHGEKIVMRILDNASGSPKNVTNIGLSQYHQDIYARHYDRPHGMILITGPTGSGKSTTLYATLNTIKNPTINIMTIEDPVESQMEGVSQIAINNTAGLNFATVLRALLRADPDVMLVGEIRDRETANLAVEAAQTGHLVLSTLHTNDASSAVTRLIEMGVEPFLVGSALSLVVAQRLLRRLCDRCAVYYDPDDAGLISSGFPWKPGDPKPKIKKAVGCKHCARTGYRGRLGIHEMLEVDTAIERLANQGAPTDEIRKVAVEKNGMKLMKEDGWEKVLNGDTTIEEVLRVTK